MKRYKITVDGRAFDVRVLSDPRQEQVQVEVDGTTLTVDARTQPLQRNEATVSSDPAPPTDSARSEAVAVGTLEAPLPGEIKSLAVRPGQQVEVGASGGVTWLGIAASLGGALFIGVLGGLESLVLRQGYAYAGTLLLAATAGGLAGSLLDSLLGATVQAIYWCDACGKETEREVHRCGTETHLLRGWLWLGNDLVNFIASAAGALVAAGIGWGLLP